MTFYFSNYGSSFEDENPYQPYSNQKLIIYIKSSDQNLKQVGGNNSSNINSRLVNQL